MDFIADLRTKAARQRAWLIGDQAWMRQWLLERANAAQSGNFEIKSRFGAKCLALAAAHAPDLLRKAISAHWETEPRIPAGSGRESGRWTRLAGDAPGLGHNQGPPLEDNKPQVPKTRPGVSKERTQALREASKFGKGRGLSALSALLQSIPWLRDQEAIIRAGMDPPDTLENLQAAVSDPRPGYQIHHINEQGPAEEDKFSRSLIDGPDNLVRIPTIVHRDITGWYARPNRDFDYKSPRDYLRGKGWEERRDVGLRALREFGVLKP